jgi:hypothetical protein
VCRKEEAAKTSASDDASDSYDSASPEPAADRLTYLTPASCFWSSICVSI